MKKSIMNLFVIVSACICWAQASGQPLQSPNPEPPRVTGKIQEGKIRVGDRERSYVAYLPASLSPGAALVIVLHGSNMTGERMRRATGWIFELLADRRGFALVYPNAHQGTWNECRKDASASARIAGIDDVGFVRALIGSFTTEFKIDHKKVNVFGFSGGGHMGFRLAFEAPGEIAAVAAAGASLPTPESSSCPVDGKTSRIMLINGSADPINPYDGGPHPAGGSVMSSQASVMAVAKRNNMLARPVEKVIQLPSKGDQTSVHLLTWQRGGQSVVALYSIRGGGYVIPQPVFRFPEHLGVTGSFDTPSAAITFFALD